MRPTAFDPALSELRDFVTYMTLQDAKLRSLNSSKVSGASARRLQTQARSSVLWRTTNEFQSMYTRFISCLNEQSRDAADELRHQSNRLSKCDSRAAQYDAYLRLGAVPRSMRCNVNPELIVSYRDDDLADSWERELHAAAASLMRNIVVWLKTTKRPTIESKLEAARQRLLDAGELSEPQVDELCSFLERERTLVSQADRRRVDTTTSRVAAEYGCSTESWAAARLWGPPPPHRAPPPPPPPPPTTTQSERRRPRSRQSGESSSSSHRDASLSPTPLHASY